MIKLYFFYLNKDKNSNYLFLLSSKENKKCYLDKKKDDILLHNIMLNIQVVHFGIWIIIDNS